MPGGLSRQPLSRWEGETFFRRWARTTCDEGMWIKHLTNFESGRLLDAGRTDKTGHLGGGQLAISRFL